MAKKFLTGLNLVVLDTDPTAGSEGELYFNSSASVAKIYQAGAWSVLGAGGGGGSTTVSTTEPESPEIGDSWYKNDTGEFYVYDGTYWVEVNGVVSLSQEQVQDYVAPLFTHENHVNASVTYDDELNQLHIDVVSAPTAGFTSTLKHDVRLNGSIAKGQAVYVSSANGTNMVVSKASNASEATSSKTLGLLETGGSNNALVKVVTEGLLAGLNTSTANSEGDPVWLGTDGNLIYGLANKPYAPAHLVFIGIVTRKNSSNGEIFVKVQNGFELNEIHDVGIGYGNSIGDEQTLVYSSSASLWQNKLQEEVFLRVYNNSGSVIPALSPVYYVEDTVNGINVGIADSNSALDPNKLPAIGITKSSIANGSYGNIVLYGKISGIDTNEFDSGDSLFVASGGGLTSSRPTGTANVQEVGKVVVGQSASAGQILVYNTGRKNDIPNLAEGKVWLGNLTAYPVATTLDTSIVPEGGSGPYYFTNEKAVDALSTTLENYLTTSSASSTYLTQANASTSYLTQASASTTYLTQESASTTYLTQPSASSTYAPIVNPVFTNNVEIEGDLKFDVISGTPTGLISISNGPGYNQFRVSASDWLSLSAANNVSLISVNSIISLDGGDKVLISGTNGEFLNNHTIADNQIATIGNISASISSHNHTLDSLSNVVITGTPSDGQSIVWDTTTSKWVNETVSGGASYPDQSGNNGKFLQTDGTDVSWADETDPIYIASSWYTTTNNSSNWDVASGAVFAGNSNWDTAYGWGDHSAVGYLTSESDTLETVTDRGATSSNAITISNTTQSTTPTSGALIISGGVGIAKDVWIDGDLHVNGTTITENTQTVATHDNLIYLNAAQDTTITNAVFASGSITYTAENLYTAGMDIRITGVDPSGFNISSGDNLTVASATPTQFIVVKSDPGASYVSGGTAHAKEEANPDLGFAGGYYDAGYAHAGLFRDSSDGVFKFFKGYTPEPDEAVNIDTTHASFALADISAKRMIFGTDYNVAIGNGALDFSTGNRNTGIGENALGYSTANNTIAIGSYGPGSDSSGIFNIFIGASSGTTLTGSWNIAIGADAGYGDITGDNNIFFGNSSGTQLTSGSYNVIIGSNNGSDIATSSNNIIISDGEGNARAQYLSANSGWTLGTITSGTWNGTEIGYTYGGTGLTTLGTAGQVLAVNASATAIEWITPSGGGSSFTDSAGLAAALSDETGTGSVVFNTSPTLIGDVRIGDSSVSTASQSLQLGVGRTDSGYSFIDLVGDTTYTDYGLRFIRNNNGANADSTINHRGTGNLRLITEDAGAINLVTSNTNRLVISSAGDITFKSTVNTDVTTGTTSATATFNTTVYSSAEFIVYGSTASGNYVSKIMMLARGTATPVITEYAILTQGTAPTVTITPSYSAPNAVLTVGVTSGTNIEIVKTAVSI